MTIIGAAFTPRGTFFFSDLIQYYLTENTIEDVLNHTLEIDHSNLKEHITSYKIAASKIHRITEKIGLVCGGDGRFSDIIEGLNTCEDTVAQILERLKCKGKINAYWTCHVAQLDKLTSITYKNGEIEITEQTTDTIWFDSFAPEIKELFFKKYINFFYLATTQEKIKIINEFFKEVTELFGGLAGGKAEIAVLNEQGFQWIRSQNFTTYSLNWMPEKIETQSTTEVAWSQQAWTTVLDLNFECESTMLLTVLAHAVGRLYSTDSGHKGFSFRITLDDTELYDATMRFIGYHQAGNYRQDNYSVHNVAIKEKGSHSLKLQMYTESLNCNLYTYGRRLSILKGFYKGGTT
jgi:hypothetical protein